MNEYIQFMAGETGDGLHVNSHRAGEMGGIEDERSAS